MRLLNRNRFKTDTEYIAYLEGELIKRTKKTREQLAYDLCGDDTRKDINALTNMIYRFEEGQTPEACIAPVVEIEGTWLESVCSSFSYTAAWSEPQCRSNEPTYGASWNKAICTKQPAVFKSEWTEPVCLKAETELSGAWDTPICVVSTPAFSAEWKKPVCITPQTIFAAAWSEPICLPQTV